MYFTRTLAVLFATARGIVGHDSGSTYPTADNDTHLHTHGSNFVPDYVLRVTHENHTVACQTHTSVLVNGTSPGPTLRLPPGKTTWIRVCNDMEEHNTTMVLLMSVRFMWLEFADTS